jgi:sucrose-6-phosphate hydrolase SacC (GH32 family)
MLKLDDHFVWDSWYARDGDRWHAFYLKAPKSIGDPELRHWNVSVGHSVSDDLVNWEHLGTCFRPSEGPAWDDYTTWTGSVVRDDAGLWHLFYTGASRMARTRSTSGSATRRRATCTTGSGWATGSASTSWGRPPDTTRPSSRPASGTTARCATRGS